MYVGCGVREWPIDNRGWDDKTLRGGTTSPHSTLALGELGRFPDESKIPLLNTLNRLRLEQSSMNPVLSEAFSTMKSENLQRLKYIPVQ